MGLPPDSIVEFTLARMRTSLAQRTSENDVTNERSGLLFSAMYMMHFRADCLWTLDSLL
ncbi:MAG: hypothetical protein RLY17_1079 [Pseudomonadota bacterium]|jgi:hypothetical protein